MSAVAPSASIPGDLTIKTITNADIACLVTVAFNAPIDVASTILIAFGTT